MGQKLKYIQKNSEGWILIKLQCVIYLSMDSSHWALQTYGKIFSNFELVFDFLTGNQGCGVGGVACFQLESGVGVGFLKLLESESVFQNCWSRNIFCNYRLQCLLNNLNYNINCLKIITGYWQYWLYSECP